MPVIKIICKLAFKLTTKEFITSSEISPGVLQNVIYI